MPGGQHLLDEFAERIGNVPGEAGFQHQGQFGLGLSNALGNGLFEPRVQGNGAQGAILRLIRPGDLEAQCAPGAFGQAHRGFC